MLVCFTLQVKKESRIGSTKFFGSCGITEIKALHEGRKKLNGYTHTEAAATHLALFTLSPVHLMYIWKEEIWPLLNGVLEL